MDAIERAIRNAFEKGDAEDPDFRERVYASAYSALDRALKGHAGMTVEVAIERRRALQHRIAEIESEFHPAVPEDLPLVDAPKMDRPRGPDIGVPDFSAFHSPSAPPPEVAVDYGRTEPTFGAPDPDMGPSPGNPGFAEVRADVDPRRAQRGRGRFAAVFVAATLVAAVGMGIWWAAQTGLLRSAEERNTTVPNPPQTIEDEDFDPEPAAEGQAPQVPPPLHAEATAENWINVFSPADPTTANAATGAGAEVMQDESGMFLRVRSGEGGAAVLFDVGQGVLEQAAGKRAVFDIIARAEEGQETEITVDCNFGELGDCGRKRYLVGYERGEYLFEIALPDRSPGAGGTIAIVSDFSNQGKSVDIYEIRVSVAE